MFCTCRHVKTILNRILSPMPDYIKIFFILLQLSRLTQESRHQWFLSYANPSPPQRLSMRLQKLVVKDKQSRTQDDCFQQLLSLSARWVISRPELAARLLDELPKLFVKPTEMNFFFVSFKDKNRDSSANSRRLSYKTISVDPSWLDKTTFVLLR